MKPRPPSAQSQLESQPHLQVRTITPDDDYLSAFSCFKMNMKVFADCCGCEFSIMDQREDQKEEEPLSETKDQSKAQSNKPEDDRKHGRKRKSEPSAESWRSNLSKDQGIDFKSDHPSATERRA
ncbi:hypothetical protein AMECASPLE_034962 [Ameca splendens]|uniref:Uncharacterized protein n=1 Tax=Ameca splendens TaxID=208324 RepID=A0ABV0XKG1_9TELE